MKNKYKIFFSLIIFLISQKLLFNNEKYDIIVNKNNKLDKNYKPKDLVKINLKCSNKEKYLRKEAALNFETMCNDAEKLGYRIVAVSAYRSYYYQKELFNMYLKTMGKKAFESSAKPGYSEHQTGLALDIEGSNYDYNKFLYTKEYKWIKDNAYKYGFIIRYPKGKEKITGYKFEPWHIRYVGKKIAKSIYEKNITLEEYKKTH